MIFVTVGGSPLGFTRLIAAMDDIAKIIDEEIIIQIGSTNFKPVNSQYFTQLPKEAYNDLFKKSRIIVCHGGAGSLINALKFSKPIIVVPRKKEFGEVIDDQQMELTVELEKEGKIIAIYDINNLYPCINNSKLLKKHIQTNELNLVTKLKEYIDFLEKQM